MGDGTVMRDRERLVGAVEALEATFRRSAALAHADFALNRKEAIALRRLISEKLAEIFQLGTAHFNGSAVSNAFRSEFSSMRSSMALHHASWPVVAIDLDNPDYIRSVASLRESNGKFLIWIRSHLAEKVDAERRPDSG